jgi:hypothetical protein
MGVLHVMGGIVTGSAFPVRPEQLTVEWLEGLIRAGGELAAGERLVSFEVKPVGEVIGVLGEVVRVFLTYGKPGAGPATLVIKFAHKNAENRQIANNTKMYEREVLFFNEVAKEVAMPMTKCYFAQMDPATGGNAVVIEDLVGYDVGDQVRGVTSEQVKMVIDAIAPLHARFYDNWRENFGHMMTIDSEEYIEGFTPGFFGTWEQAIKNFPECFPRELLDAMPRYVASLKRVMKDMGKRKMTFIHGDVKMDNAMFGGGKSGLLPVIMIDWQNMMISNPLQDLAWLAASSLKVDVRRAIEDEYLEYYRAKMAENGVTGYTIEQIRDDYDVGLLFIMNFNILIAGAFVPSSERDRQMAIAGLERAIAAVLDRGLLARLPA